MDVGWPFKENHILWDFLTQSLLKSYKFKKKVKQIYIILFQQATKINFLLTKGIYVLISFCCEKLKYHVLSPFSASINVHT